MGHRNRDRKERHQTLGRHSTQQIRSYGPTQRGLEVFPLCPSCRPAIASPPPHRPGEYPTVFERSQACLNEDLVVSVCNGFACAVRMTVCPPPGLSSQRSQQCAALPQASAREHHTRNLVWSRIRRPCCVGVRLPLLAPLSPGPTLAEAR